MPVPSRAGARRIASTLVLLAAVLAVLLPSAAASPWSGDARHRFDRMAASSAMDPTLRRALVAAAEPFGAADPLLLAAAARGSNPGTPTFSVELQAPLADRRYRMLRFGATSGPGGGVFGANTTRFDRESGSGQIYEWFHRAPAGVLRVGARTRRAHLVVDTNLATADLRFTPAVETNNETSCLFSFPGPPRGELTKITSTSGRLVGEFAFTPHESIFETKATDVRAIVQRFTPLGRPCGHGGFFCPRQWYFVFGRDGTKVEASKAPPDRPADLFALRTIGGSANYEVQLIGAFSSSADPVTRSSERVVVDGNAAGPFVAGRIVFDRTRQLPRVRTCGAYAARHAFEWSAGSFDVRYDAGLVDLTGQHLVARSYLLYHHLA